MEIHITSKIKDYSVLFIDEIENIFDNVKGKNIFYIFDNKVRKLYPNLVNNIDSKKVLFLSADEEIKTLSGACLIFDFFLKNNINKKSEIVAIGGGVIQDVVTLATHIFHRGIEWTYVPTTLLAMSDSCIGAKSAINYKGFKNPLGVFHPPKMILLHPGFIKTLNYSDLLSGYGEIIKLCIIGKKNLNMLNTLNIQGLLSKDEMNLSNIDSLIKSSLLIKKEYIEEDEFDSGSRRILNYGHTFGHALESVLKNEIPHGKAVVIGIDIVNYVSFRLGLLSKTDFDSCRNFYDKLYCEQSISSFKGNMLFDKIRKDKKAIDGNILLALAKSPGNFTLQFVSIDDELQGFFNDYIKENNIFNLTVS